jgi:hypothetical protein
MSGVNVTEEFELFFIQLNGKVLCLICTETMVVLTGYNFWESKFVWKSVLYPGKVYAGDLEAMKCCLSLQKNNVAQARTNSEAATWPSFG